MKWNYKILTCDSCLENLLILITIKMIVQLTKNDSPLSLSYDHDWYSSMIMKMTMIMKMIIILSPAESINICYKDLWFVYISSTINLPPRTNWPTDTEPAGFISCKSLLPATSAIPRSGKSQEVTKVKCTICSETPPETDLKHNLHGCLKTKMMMSKLGIVLQGLFSGSVLVFEGVRSYKQLHQMLKHERFMTFHDLIESAPFCLTSWFTKWIKWDKTWDIILVTHLTPAPPPSLALSPVLLLFCSTSSAQHSLWCSHLEKPT